MPSNFRLFCLRHGRTTWNAVGKFQGRSDIDLDETGRAQAALSAEFLRPFPIEYCAHSDLRRARETAEIALAGRAVPRVADEDWRERHFGEWEGLTWAEITARHPELARETLANAGTFEPAGGEAFSEAIARALRAFARVDAAMREGGTALVVAHAGILHALFDGLFGADRERFVIAPASVVELDVVDGRARLSARERFIPVVS